VSLITDWENVKEFWNLADSFDRLFPSALPPIGLKPNIANILTFLALRELFMVVPMSVPIFIADSASVFAFANPGNFSHTGGDVAFSSVAASPLYSFELDTVGQHACPATGGGSNDTLTMKGVNHDKKE
jgi:hypothetical protein